MGDGAKMAIGILVMWIALVFFFFAFHPGGVSDVKNPVDMLKWLMDEFGKLVGGGSSASGTPTGDITSPAPSTDTTPAQIPQTGSAG